MIVDLILLIIDLVNAGLKMRIVGWKSNISSIELLESIIELMHLLFNSDRCLRLMMMYDVRGVMNNCWLHKLGRHHLVLLRLLGPMLLSHSHQVARFLKRVDAYFAADIREELLPLIF